MDVVVVVVVEEIVHSLRRLEGSWLHQETPQRTATRCAPRVIRCWPQAEVSVGERRQRRVSLQEILAFGKYRTLIDDAIRYDVVHCW